MSIAKTLKTCKILFFLLLSILSSTAMAAQPDYLEVVGYANVMDGR